MPYSFMTVPIALRHDRILEARFRLTFRNPSLHSHFEGRDDVGIYFSEVVVFVRILNEVIQFDPAV